MKRNKRLSKETRELYSSLGRSLFLCFVALFAIVTATAAWFVANSHVNSGTSPISSEFEPVKLAVLQNYERQNAELINLKLPDGKPFEDAGGNLYYYTDTETIALRLDKNGYNMSPGSRGKIEFYVISNGASEVTLELELGAYGENENNEVIKIDNDILSLLMRGHVLFFNNYRDGVYSDWLLNNDGSGNWSNSISINLSGKEAGVPTKVDIYWIWPIRYENLANDFAETKKFVDIQSNDESMIAISNDNAYKYNLIYLSDKSIGDSIDNRSEAYDLADEYIGSNAQYLYLKIQTGEEEVH